MNPAPGAGRGRSLLLAGLALAALGLFACGPRSAPPGVIRLELWTIALKPRFTAFMEGLLARHEASHPGLEVSWIDLPQRSVQQKMMAAIAGGLAPDLVNVNTPFALELAQNGALVDMQRAVPAEARARYFPNLWEAARTAEGVFAIPWYVSVRVLIYNEALFRQAGLDPERPPGTWEEVAACARQVRSRTSAYGVLPVVRFAEELAMSGIPIHEPGTGRALFHAPAGVARLAWHRALIQEGVVPREGLSEGYQGALDRYKQGALAILEAGPQLLLQIRADAPGVYASTRVAPLPMGAARILPASTMNFVVPRASAHQEEAVALALSLTSPENQLALAREVPLLPSTMETAAHPLFKARGGADGGGDGGGRLLDEALAVSVGQLPRARDLSLGLPRQAELNRILKEAVEAALYGIAPPEAALARAAAEWDAALGLPPAGASAGGGGEAPPGP